MGAGRSRFERASPYHRVIHVDAGSSWRVHGRCDSPARMRHVSWFVLPAGQEFYYRRHSASYRPLPALRADCLADAAAEDKQQTIEFLYPNVGTRLYIPVDLGDRRAARYSKPYTAIRERRSTGTSTSDTSARPPCSISKRWTSRRGRTLSL